jgi:hypothetical protein
VVVDNASRERARPPEELAGRVPVRVIRLEENLGAAARNIGVRAASPDAQWVVMLDDDSVPIDGAFVDLLARQPGDVSAVMADIVLPDGSRERGGLPEVFIGCGVAIRRGVFERLGGYDASFGYYAEEYDLAARMLIAGFRVVFEPGFGVVHRKVTGQRDMGLILSRLVRNNAWVMQRYAPDAELAARLAENEQRYRAIAAKEGVVPAFEAGADEVRRTLGTQPRTPMPEALWRRFTGEAAAQAAIAEQIKRLRDARGPRACVTVCVVERGKNDWAIDRVLAGQAEQGVARVTSDLHAAEAVVIGTMSPGPMLDAAERWRARLHASSSGAVITPWMRAVGVAASRRPAARA